jgi:hypothetical protein
MSSFNEQFLGLTIGKIKDLTSEIINLTKSMESMEVKNGIPNRTETVARRK